MILARKSKVRHQASKGFFVYQKAMWYVAQAGAEAGKPLRFVTEFGILILLLSDSGFTTSWQIKVACYVLIILLAIIIGRALVLSGVVDYNSRLGNSVNPELQQILKKVQNIEFKLDNLENTRNNKRR